MYSLSDLGYKVDGRSKAFRKLSDGAQKEFRFIVRQEFGVKTYDARHEAELVESGLCYVFDRAPGWALTLEIDTDAALAVGVLKE